MRSDFSAKQAESTVNTTEHDPGEQNILNGSFLQGTGVAVLVGGKSSRMGTDKAALRFDDAPFYQILCERMNFFPERFLSVNSFQNYSYPGYTLIRDEYPDTGPMGGILSVLNHFHGRCLMVIACDMPFFSENEARRLLEQYHGEDALIPVADGRWQPLCALYSASVSSLFLENIRKGDYRLKNAVTGADFRTVEISGDHAGCYLNINTPDDLKMYCESRSGGKLG